jgi:predicted transcriptional regulator of viral defense system
MARKLGQIESSALAYVQMRNLRTIATGHLANALHLSIKQERELLSRMARSGVIANVRKGLYLFPSKLPLGGVWTPDDATAIGALMTDRQAVYQITGPSAFNHYGYDEQIPSRTTLYNDALSGERTIGKVNLTLIKVNRDRLGGTERIALRSGETLIYSSRVRTLVDAVYDWSRFDSLPRAYGWIRDDLKAGRITANDLAKATIRYGNMGTLRRIGAWLQLMNADKRVLNRLGRAMTPSTAKIPLVPGSPTRGELLLPWGVVVNA